ncbi:3-oxoacyl-[acyl-carrier-protein] reductase [Neolewinella lacunae]|uniref:3-oxoacyl-[acyl-carrier-protein] reductase n=1 Tax=Neolewinella lacunae TaxID=1517758 RepID=A0A923PNZ1_9BACT|nr:3-oxoacyl-[acyl-carrier-protein] reductase [Neolewinella lacunae]MBC6994804.1 3-oxoacyl-[acyl-carrier-protein] reductase [Neolewinella lacunae]MDN3634426.1 3-oxoacyl-[acyl-carrier-protein] reductase [Neolewinella lacunae]
MGLLTGKTALITGGSRGIGAAIVRYFVAEGARVAFTYARSAGPAEALVQELGEGVRAYQSDAASYAAAGELVKQVTEDFGGFDILVNNAGITRDTLLLRMSEEQWDEVMNNNLKSIFNLTKQALRPLMKSGSGSVINMSSIVGVTGQAGQANYAASKAGIIGFSKSLAKEMGSRNIRCNVVAPGFIVTDMTDELPEALREGYLSQIPLKRLGNPEEIAKVCAFLGSELSSYVNGQVLGVDGGLS